MFPADKIKDVGGALPSKEASGITKLKQGDVAELCVVVGDPKRAEQFAGLMENVVLVAENREYWTFTGTYKEKRVTVASHGVGGGGASMCFEELIANGAKVLIRAGTCGSFQSKWTAGNLIVATGAVRSDGVTDNLVPREFPAICDHQIVQTLVDTLKENGEKGFGCGIVVTEGPFYSGPLGNKNRLWEACGCAAVEMEVAVLLVIASIRGVRAGAILNTDNYIFQRMEEGDYNPHKPEVAEGTARMAKHVLDAIVRVPL